METLSVTFRRTTWVSQDRDDDGLIWGIYQVTYGDDELATIKGKLEPRMANLGMEFEVTGKWENDSKYGRQFVFSNFSRRQPNGRWGTMAFLMQAEGVGETLAGRIYEAFGEESISAIIDTPEIVASRTVGLRVEVAEEASQTLAPLINESKLKLPLLDLFKGTKLPAKTANRVIEARIPDPVNRIRSNPFMLTEFKGIAFKQADSLRLKLKLAVDMPERIAAACMQTFRDESDQTWLTADEITKKMSELLEVPTLNAKMYIDSLIDDEKIVSRHGVMNGTLPAVHTIHYAEMENYKNELFVAEYLHNRMQQSAPEWLVTAVSNIDTTVRGEITEHQKNVLLNNICAGGRMLVLPGSPGTGKTFTLGRILSMFNEFHACAPTGKAAQRLTQSLKGKVATTIHRLLGPKPLSGGGFAFSLQNGEIKFDAVAVDEASMVNNELAAALFRGLHPDTYLILVGDQNQLPPVGPGTMLRDLQSTGKFQELTEIKRNQGMIVHSCAAIREMRNPAFHMQHNPGMDVKEATNVHLAMSTKDDAKMIWIRKVVDQIQATGLSYKGGMTKSLHDIQFVTATHRNPHVGREALNKYLQSRFNKNMSGKHPKFKVGDKVICTENCFLSPTKPTEDMSGKPNKVFVANGDLGVVLESFEKRMIVRVTSTSEEVLVPCGAEGHGWDLGYCITTHKAQGSEWPIVIVCMGSDFGSEMVMSREWVYTAISRAKDCCIIVSGPGQIAKQVKKVRINDRRSSILNYWEVWDGEETDTETEVDASDGQPGADPVDF